MFEKLVESLVNEYFSEWVDGLDAEKMKVGLFSGKVEFHELKLKSTTLDKLQLPVKLKEGTLGKLAIKVPWKRLTSQAVRIQVEDLFLLLVPAHQDTNKNDRDAYAERLRWAKQQEIKVRELVEKTKNDTSTTTNAEAIEMDLSSSTNNSGDMTTSWGLREKIIHNMMDNVSFEFRNIHIRYEDITEVISRNPLAMGIKIDAITIHTTNANGHVTFVDRAQSHTPFVHKILEMTKAGFYCDDFSTVEQLMKKEESHQIHPNAYILHPFSSTIKMTVNHDEKTVFSIPRYQFVADISSINASVSPNQCNDLISELNFFTTHEVYLKQIHCKRRRPTVPIKSNGSAWWKYAFYGVQVMYNLNTRVERSIALNTNRATTSVTRKKRAKCTWKLFGKLWLKRSEYIGLYKKMLRGATKKLPIETLLPVRARLLEMEDELEAENIVFFRLCAAQELELEESRQDNVKKLSNWKTRWGLRSQSNSADLDHSKNNTNSPSVSGVNLSSTSHGFNTKITQLEPLERLLVYSSVHDQLQISATSSPSAVTQHRKSTSSSDTLYSVIQFALDVAVASFRFSLVEEYEEETTALVAKQSVDAQVVVGQSKEFLRFELQKLMATVLERDGGSRMVSCCIKGIEMLDLTDVEKPQDTPQPLLYAVQGSQKPTSKSKSGASATAEAFAAAAAATATALAAMGVAKNNKIVTESSTNFFELKWDFSRTKVKFDCAFLPFRFIYNFSVVAKLQTYFFAQISAVVAPNVRENAEEAFAQSIANSSNWLSNVVMSSDPSGSPTANGGDGGNVLDEPVCVVEFNVRMPEIDVLMLTSGKTSPILEFKLSDLHLHNELIFDTFTFSIDGVEIIFFDGLDASSTECVSAKALGSHASRTTQVLALEKRKRSTILKRTQLEFNGTKETLARSKERKEPITRWNMQCTAPPILLHLTNTQYQQVLEAASVFTAGSISDNTNTSEVFNNHSVANEKNAFESRKSNSSSTSAIRRAKTSKKFELPSPEYDPEDQRFGLCVHIPSIEFLVEGGNRLCTPPPQRLRGKMHHHRHMSLSPKSKVAASASSGYSSPKKKHVDEQKVINLVLQMKKVNLEAKFSSVAKSGGVDFESLIISRKPDIEKKENTKEQEEDDEEEEDEEEYSSDQEENHHKAEFPAPAYNPDGTCCAKLFELSSKCSILISNVDPLKIKVNITQVALYWDYELLFALYQSYLFGEILPSSNASSANSSASSSRSASRNLASAVAKAFASNTAANLNATAEQLKDLALILDQQADVFAAAALKASRFGLEFNVEHCHLFLRAYSPRFACFTIHLHVKDLYGDISTLRTPYTVMKFYPRQGVTMDCLQSLPIKEDGSVELHREIDQQKPCQLLHVPGGARILYESAGYGDLYHRERAGGYLNITAAKVLINYVHGHFRLLLGHLNREVLGFLGYIGDIMKPSDVLLINMRTKLDAQIDKVRILVPREPAAAEKRERLELDIEKISIHSSKCQMNPRFEQLHITCENVNLSTHLGSSTTPTGYSRAGHRILKNQLVLIEYAALPIIEEPNRLKKSRMKRLDMEDVEDILENYCVHVNIRLVHGMQSKNVNSKHPLNSTCSNESIKSKSTSDNAAAARVASKKTPIDSTNSTSGSFSPTKKPAKKKADGEPVLEHLEISLTEHQYQLLQCISDENFFQAESVYVFDEKDVAKSERKVNQVHLDLGKVVVKLYQSKELTTDGQKSVGSGSNMKKKQKLLGRIDMDKAVVTIEDFSSWRSQYHIFIGNKAKIWKAITLESALNEDLNSSNKVMMIPCAEIYSPNSRGPIPAPHLRTANGVGTTITAAWASQTKSSGCIDITVDVQPPVVINSKGQKPPKEVRMHIDTCAITPSLLSFAQIMLPFVATPSSIPLYKPSASQQMNLNMTLGTFHFMLVQHLCTRYNESPKTAHRNSSGSLNMSRDAAQIVPTDGCPMMNLVLSGCIVVKYSNADVSQNHIQVFGRTMSLAVVSDWPPSIEKTKAEDINVTMTNANASRPNNSGTSSRAQTIKNYRRVLCDDFGLEFDIADTFAVDQMYKINFSLTHCHAVLSSFDLFLFSKLYQLTAQLEKPKGIRKGTSTAIYLAGTAVKKRKSVVVWMNAEIEDASITMIREVGEYFTPLARFYSYYTLFSLHIDVETTPETGAQAISMDFKLNFSDEVSSERNLREDEGLSIWAFNSVIGAWEPLLEPWTYDFASTFFMDEGNQKISLKCTLDGNKYQSLNVNFSPVLLESFCEVIKELEPLFALSSSQARNSIGMNRDPIPFSTAQVISCGFYLANDCGKSISYWISRDAQINMMKHTAKTASGYNIAMSPRQQKPETLASGQKVPLKFSTALFPALPTDQTLSFSWGEDEYYPLTDVRMHSAGKFVYSVLSKNQKSSNISNTQPPVLLALFDISAVFGYRTLIVSSTIRVFNDTHIVVECGVLCDDGKTIVEMGAIEPKEARGVPIHLIKSISSVRLLMKPHLHAQEQDLSSQRDYRWSNELMLNEKEENTETAASSSRVMDDYDCKCQRMLDGSQPLHVGQVCRSNAAFFRIWNRIFIASNGSSLKYGQLHIMPPLTFENKCHTSIHAVVFVFRKVRRAGLNQDRENIHLVFSEKIAPRSSCQFFAASLQEKTYCAISLTGYSWSKLFPLPIATSASTTSSSKGISSSSLANSMLEAVGVGPGAGSAGGAGSVGGSSLHSETSPHSHLSVLCTLQDFEQREATLNVLLNSATIENPVRKVIIQPKFIIKNQSSVKLALEESTSVSKLNAFVPTKFIPNKIPAGKNLLSQLKNPLNLTRSSSNENDNTTASPEEEEAAKQCCGTTQLENIHTKLNALVDTASPGNPSSPLSGTTVESPTTLSRSLHTSSSYSSSRDNNVTQTEQEDFNCFYISEGTTINVQVAGNNESSSGVSNFRLDNASVGGANSFVRLYDESKSQWCDLAVLVEQIDSFCTQITFLERYVFVNRTSFDLMCLPAVDINISGNGTNSGTSSSSNTSSVASTVASLLSPSAAASRMMSPNQVSASSPIAVGTLRTLSPLIFPGQTSFATFHWLQKDVIPDDSCVRLKIHDENVSGWRWGGKFSLHEVSDTAFKMSNKFTSQVSVLRIAVKIEKSVRVFVVVTSEDKESFPLYRIVNSCKDEVIHFRQSFDGGGEDLNEHSNASVEFNRGVMQRLFPGQSTCFGWDEAYFLQNLERILLLSFHADLASSKIVLDQHLETLKVDIPATKTKAAKQIYVHWYLHGVTKTVLLADHEIPRDKLTGTKGSHASLIAGINTFQSPHAHIQIEAKSTSIELAFELQIPSMFFSVLNETPDEVLLLSSENVQLNYSNRIGQDDQIEIKVGMLQLDNQHEHAVFPVVFTPIPSHRSRSRPSSLQKRESDSSTGSINEESEEQQQPVKSDQDQEDDLFFHFSAFRVNYSEGVEFFKYFSAMLQPGKLQIDDHFLVSVASLFTNCYHIYQRFFPAFHITSASTNNQLELASATTGDSSRSKRATSDSSSTNLMTPANSEKRVYIETLQLHPIKLQLTFQQNNLAKSTYYDEQTILVPIVLWILKSNLANIDTASIHLNALHVYHSFGTPSFIFSAVQQHYIFQGILQIYALIGSADILGNPLGLVNNLGTGVKDFFYEPAAGLVKSPQDFVVGLSKGTASLVKNSVYGTFNAASKLTGTISSGIAALSMDSDYINARNTRNRKEVVTHVGTGLYYGTKQLGKGILEGFSGVITAPALGAYNNGLTGFVEGVGKGLIGVAIKPTAGILDLAAKTTAGITATATVFDKKPRSTRVRLPRMMHTSDKRLKVYSVDEALISQLLTRLPGKLLANENYEDHVFLSGTKAIVVTSHQLIHAEYTSINLNHPKISWKHPVACVWGAQKTPKGVNIMIGAATRNEVAGGGAATGAGSINKIASTNILVPLKDTEAALGDKVTKLITDLVARQRERMPITETLSAPLPRNSIGLVLEPLSNHQKKDVPEEYDGCGRISDVIIGSASYRAGVQVDDILVGFGRQKLESGDHGSALRYQLSMMKKGEALELHLLRGKETKIVKVIAE